MVLLNNPMNFPLNLMDQKLEIKSEPDYDVAYLQEFLNEGEIKNKLGNYRAENINSMLDSKISKEN